MNTTGYCCAGNLLCMRTTTREFLMRPCADLVPLLHELRVGEPAIGNRVSGHVSCAVAQPVALSRGVARSARVRVGLPLAAVPNHGELLRDKKKNIFLQPQVTPTAAKASRPQKYTWYLVYFTDKLTHCCLRQFIRHLHSIILWLQFGQKVSLTILLVQFC